MNIFLFNNRAWFLYTILIDHPAITLKNIYEILQGYATDIRFNDYYSLILARQFADLLTENRTVVELEIFFKKFNDAFKANEIIIAKLQLKKWFENKQILLTEKANREELFQNQITLQDYIDRLYIRGA